MRTTLFVFLACLIAVHAKLGELKIGEMDHNMEDSLGDRVDVTFGKFSSLPTTESDAISDGWTAVDDSCGTYGYRYRLNGDYALAMLYDVTGELAGIQVSVETVESKSWANFPDIYEEVDGLYSMTVLFVDPDTLCSTSTEKGDDFGDRFLLRQSDGSYMDIAVNSNDLAIGAPEWVLGACFISMGTHYWKNISTDMSCEYFFPVAVMYTSDSLVTFLFALNDFTGGIESSSRWEHPPQSSLSLFFKSDCNPQCLYTEGLGISTMHFFIKNPFWNMCLS